MLCLDDAFELEPIQELNKIHDSIFFLIIIVLIIIFFLFDFKLIIKKIKSFLKK